MTKRAQVDGLISAAQAAKLTIYAIEIGPRTARVVTLPLGESRPSEDAAERWLRGKLDEGQSSGRA